MLHSTIRAVKGEEGVALTGQMPKRLVTCLLLVVLWLGVATNGHSQTLPPYSVAVGLPTPTGLTTLPGLNEAQQSMAQSINNVCPTINAIAVTANQRDLATVCSAMIGTSLQVQGQPNPLGLPSFGIGKDALVGALESLNGGPEIVVPTSQSSALQVQQSQQLEGVVEARMSMLRKPDAGLELAAVPQFAQFAQARAPWSTDAYSSPYPPRPVAMTYQSGPLGVYLNGLGQFGSHDLTSRQNGYSFNNAGIIAGADYRFNPQFAAGLAFSYTQANTDFDTSAVSPAGQSIRSDLFQGSLYATYSITNALFVNATATVGGGNTDSRRRIVIPSMNPAVAAVDRFANGSFGVASHSINIGGGYNMPFGALTVTPTARFQYLRASSDGFTESGGGGLDLTFGGSGHNAYLSFVGGQAQYAIPTTLGVLTPSARFEWAHQFNSANAAVSVAYSNDPQLLSLFVLPADAISHNYFDLGVGLGLQLSPSHSAFIAYDAILGLSHTTYNSFVAGVRLIF